MVGNGLKFREVVLGRWSLWLIPPRFRFRDNEEFTRAYPGWKYKIKM